MWVFGYGSLMYDNWERAFDGCRVERARLVGYRRSFCKLSVKNWGSKEHPGPTLGLVQEENAECTGVAFEFSDARREQVLSYLREREGKSFLFPNVRVCLPDRREVEAVTSVNATTVKTYIGGVAIEERAAMACLAQGNKGSCVDYVRNAHARLEEMCIHDAEIDAFLLAIEQRLKSRS